MIGYRTLVLNNAYMPVSLFPVKTIPAEDAITKVLTGSARVVLNHSNVIKTPSRTDLYWPSVIVTNKRFSEKLRLKREALYYRDHGICQYCEKALKLNSFTYDHVVPRVKGGEHSWNNIVAACTDCNNKKGHHDPKGLWIPIKKPFEPTFGQMLEVRKKFPLVVNDIGWLDFLPGWEGEIIVENPT
ncbi:HNH endonuclease [Ochrobactrum phage vB_OspM_OC]|nr:HNH endonuclease [Ochrobactrum phage vB_OspM_OC]